MNYKKYLIIKIKSNITEKVKDNIAIEIPLTIKLNKDEIATLLCSPSYLKELSIGFLFTSGLILNKDDILNIILDKKKYLSTVSIKNDFHNNKIVFKRMYSSGCGKGILFYNAIDKQSWQKIDSELKIKKENIFDLMIKFNKKSNGYIKTGCMHSSAIADSNKILVFTEDIGRHNAVDKVIGYALLNEISLQDKILLVTGRISSDIIFKAQKTKIPIIVSSTAVTDYAMKLSKDAGITILGFVRGQRMNIYNDNERIM